MGVEGCSGCWMAAFDAGVNFYDLGSNAYYKGVAVSSAFALPFLA